MNYERKGAYKLTNKETKEIKYASLHTSGNEKDMFRTVDNEDVWFDYSENVGVFKPHETYFIEYDEDYTGPFPTWEIE